MTATETQVRPLATQIADEMTITLSPLTEATPRNSVMGSPSGFDPFNMSTPRTLKKTKDDIRYYFRPVPKEDIRIYFRPISKLIVERPRVPRSRTVSNTGKPKIRSRRVSPSGAISPTLGPEVPPKAKERSSGQKSRDVFLSKQRVGSGFGRTNQNGSIALPGFDPDLANGEINTSPNPLSPRITEVVDSSLIPSPLRNKSEVNAESAPQYDDRTDTQKYHAAHGYPSTQVYRRSVVQQYQEAALPPKPDSVYGTLPPLPVPLQGVSSQPTQPSTKIAYHSRKDTPYSPNDVGKSSALGNSEVPNKQSATSDPVGRSSSYASSDVLPTPVALEEWASEQRRIAHGQPALAHEGEPLILDNNSNSHKDKSIKKTKSIETRLFRSRKSKKNNKNKERTENEERHEPSQSVGLPNASRVLSQDLYHPSSRWDAANLPPSPETTAPSINAINSDMVVESHNSDSLSDKMIVTDAQAKNPHTSQNQSAILPRTKKPNKFIKMLEAYSKNMESLQMVQ